MAAAPLSRTTAAIGLGAATALSLAAAYLLSKPDTLPTVVQAWLRGAEIPDGSETMSAAELVAILRKMEVAAETSLKSAGEVATPLYAQVHRGRLTAQAMLLRVKKAFDESFEDACHVIAHEVGTTVAEVEEALYFWVGRSDDVREAEEALQAMAPKIWWTEEEVDEMRCDTRARYFEFCRAQIRKRREQAGWTPDSDDKDPADDPRFVGLILQSENRERGNALDAELERRGPGASILSDCYYITATKIFKQVSKERGRRVEQQAKEMEKANATLLAETIRGQERQRVQREKQMAMQQAMQRQMQGMMGGGGGMGGMGGGMMMG